MALLVHKTTQEKSFQIYEESLCRRDQPNGLNKLLRGEKYKRCAYIIATGLQNTRDF